MITISRLGVLQANADKHRTVGSLFLRGCKVQLDSTLFSLAWWRLLKSHLLLPFIMVILLASNALASTTQTYKYDELGRLIRVEKAGVSASVYDYDAAGNRLAEIVALKPGAPTSINVPASSVGSHAINWGGSTGTDIQYQLYQSSNANFTSQYLVYSGTSSNATVSVSSDGTYYYRVRACSHDVCSDYKAGSNGVVALLPPGAPVSITIPVFSLNGSATISWGAPSSGSVNTYQLYEATSANFSDQTLIHADTVNSKALSGRGNGTYYYRVRACNVSGCSGYRTGNNSLSVTLPPGTPASITVPVSNTTGNYSINWGAASGVVTAYMLYESTNSGFSGQTLIYSGAATGFAVPTKGNGVLYYRVKACNGEACSGYRTGSNSVTVTLPPGTPSSIAVPASSNNGSYAISWGSASGNVTAYELYEAKSSNFSGQVRVYNGASRSASLSGRVDGVYYYRIRACNSGVCSGYRNGSNATTVVFPPSSPVSISAPTKTNGNFTVSWSSSAGATRYELWESYYGGVYSLVYSGTSALKYFESKAGGDYGYKAKACNVGGCSGFSPVRVVRVCNPICLD